MICVDCRRSHPSPLCGHPPVQPQKPALWLRDQQFVRSYGCALRPRMGPGGREDFTATRISPPVPTEHVGSSGRQSLRWRPGGLRPSVQWSVQLVWSQPGTTWHDLAQPRRPRAATSSDTWHTWARPGTTWHDLARLPAASSSPAGPTILPPEFGLEWVVSRPSGFRGRPVCNAVCNWLGHTGARPGTTWHNRRGRLPQGAEVGTAGSACMPGSPSAMAAGG